MKNKISMRIGTWDTPPCIRKCLTSLKALTLLLVMLMSVNVWGAVTSPWSYTFLSTDQLDTSGDAITRNGVTWNIATTVGKGSPSITFVSQKYSNVSNTAMKFGNSKTVYYSAITFSTDAFASKKVSKVEITYALNGGASTTITATQGSTTIGSDTYSTGQAWNTSTLNTNEGTGGSLSISITTTQAILINTISVTFTEGTSPTDPSLSVSPATIDFGVVAVGGSVDAQDVTATLTNTDYAIATLSGTNADAFEITAGEELTETGTITVQPKATTLATKGTYSATLEVEAEGVDDAKTVTLLLKVAAPTGTFVKFTGDELKEGDYVICVGTDAMKNSVTSSRLDYASVTVSSDKITNPEASVIWHIAPVSEGVWSIFNVVYDSDKGGYAAGTGADNKAQILAATTDVSTETKAQWTCAKVAAGYNFENVGNKASSKNAKLKKNGTFGFACYADFSDITLYKTYVEPAKSAVAFASCENGSVGATVNSTAISSGAIVDEDAVVTLTNTPADGYKLTAYSVTETGGTKTVTIKEENGVYTFKMPAYAVTVSATFSLSIETPELSEAAGDKDDAFSVKVTNYNGDYSYYYTLDGTDPSNASTLYVDADGIAINASCTLKVIAYSGDVTSPVVSAAYTLPLMTMDAIFAKATAVGSTATAVRVKFTDCVISGVKNNNAYLTDNAGKGLIIYASSHGFEVNDKLNGAVNVKVQLYNGSAELTELTSSTSGLTVTKDGSVSPITTIGIASLSGVNTGAVLSYENLTYDGEYFSNGTNGIKPYNNFNIEDYPTFENGDKYNVTGVYIQFNSTKEIAPRSLADLEKIEATKYAINLATVEHGTIATDPETEAADGIKVTLSATPATGYMLSAWSVVDAESNPVEVTANQFTMPAMAVTVSATFVELPIWATTYTSNVTVGTDKVKLAEAYQPADYPTDGYDAKKDGTNSKAASIAIKVPANTTELHYHLFAWNGEGGKTVTIKKGEETLKTFENVADAGLSSNSPYTLQNNPIDAYGYVALEGITEETTITFSTAAVKNRICLFGVNAIQPAAITIDPEEKNFGEVKQGFDAEQVFTLTPNAFATGTITAEIDGDNVFTASTIADNKVTVTFAPTEIKDDYSATLVIKHDGTQMCTATLTGKGIAATTPEIAVSTDEIDFGKVKQDATVAAQTVTVTLNYLDAATASIDDDTYFSIDKTNLGAGANTITISATASSTGEKSATITITGIGATTKTITVKMDVTSKWAGEYTSNVEVGSDKVIISEEEYEAIKKGTSSKSESATITVPKGTQTLHFHAAAWNNENTVLVVKQGDTELGSFNLYKDAGVKSNSPFTLAGNNYDTDQYFYVNVSAYTATDAAEITFTTTASPYRFVLYGVNQEGGIVPELDHLTITGSATHTEYEVDETFDPAGLTVSAIYTLEDVEQDPIDVTEDVEWEFTPATLTAGSYDVTVKATYEDKEVSTTVAVTVTAATPEITVYATEVGFGTVLKDDVVEAKTVAVTLKAIAEATVEVSGEGASAFNVTPASLTESGNITITPVTTAAGEFTATITISADGAESKTISVTMNVTDGNLPKEKVDFTVVYSDVTGSSTVDFASYSGVTFSLTAAKNDGNQPKYYANGSSVRAYAKNTITISSEKTIAFILINHTGKSYQDVEATVDNGTLQVNEAYSMWTLGATSGTITLKNTVRFDNIIIFYEYDEVIRSAQSENQIGTGCQTLDIVAVKGATLYQVNYTDGCYLNFMEVTYPVKAGMPIIMQADNTNDGKIEVIYGQKSPVATEGLDKDGLYGYIGAVQFDIPNNEGYYVFKGGMLRPALDNYTTSGHAYIKLDEVPTTDQTVGSPAPRRRMSMGIERNTPTSMEEIFNAASQDGKFIINGQLFIFRDGKVFNAQGSLIK